MSAPETPTPSDPAQKTHKVAFYTAPFFRSVQADGSWGRISPSGMIHLSFFNDCGTLPSAEIRDIRPDGTISPALPQLHFSSDADLVRQFEVDVILSVEAAKSVRDNLQNFIDIVEDLKKKAKPV